MEKSFQIVQEGLQEDPFNKELYLFGGKIALKLKDVDNAVKLLKKALELDPGYIEAIITLSGVLLNQGKYVETIEMLTEIVERHEEYDPHFDFNLAIAYHRTEQYEKALKHYESAYNNFKTDPEFLENYAYFLLEEGERAKARKLFEKALELDPGNIEYENMLLELEDNF
ncbi:tetratricopeptide repeat protein [Aeribacillus sp. SP014]